MADKVMRMPKQSIQRKCTSCGNSMEEEKIQRTPLVSQISSVNQYEPMQKKCAQCEKEEQERKVQRKSKGSPSPSASSELTSKIKSSKGGGKKMGSDTLKFMESSFGVDFSGVRIHDSSQAAGMSQQIQARAFTVGQDVFFNRGEYAPGTSEGKRLLAHELTHVVQQTPKISRTSSQTDLKASNKNTSSNQTQINQAPPQISRAGWGEMWDALWGVGPIDSYKANSAATRAFKAAKSTGLPGPHNGPQDAFRHCYWNCLMTGEIGKSQAKTIADNHEKHGSGPANENSMDKYNNAEGRACGGSSCDSCCQSKLDGGKLQVLDSSGNIIPSSKTSRTGSTKEDPYYSKDYYSDPPPVKSSGVDWSKKACCFPGQVLVSTEQGLKSIESVSPGDQVLSYNVENGTAEYQEVYEVQIHNGDFAMLQLTVDDENIQVTTRHFFGLSGGNWQRSETLQKGTMLTSKDSVKTIDNITSPDSWKGTVYNLKVRGGNYFIGESNLLVRDS